ncbi:MAG: DinB family protein [Chitinophagaceae bacterium]|nr:DinB family protein [Chitinophagaceae bacterium]MCA6453281.1 DinB family protein [Chitinophagaceae bacterium]MCA6457191.1 DinB family protein [Chitinophagaceae bacterium]MCA6457902.1 DinB family protein [Chitinophagaceae bacterium]MCA6463615.1 DinB family protein [Chitinophagaceae bacterium]
MKKMIFLLSSLLFFSFSTADVGLTKEERKLAADFLTDTKNGIRDAIQGLSQAQLTFKPAPDKWSVEDCLKHIAMSEQMLWGMIEASLKNPATPEKRSEVKFKDEQVIKSVEDRSTKAKTFAPLEPVNTPFKSAEEAMASFSKQRDKLIEYVTTTNDDLRDRVNQLPVGVYDSYQMILFIGAHSNRHMQQINEVKADPAFPKK